MKRISNEPRPDVTSGQGEKGSVLVVALLIVVLLGGMTAAFLAVSTSQSRAVTAQDTSVQALYITKAGIGLAMNELNTGVDTGGDGLGFVHGTFAGGTFTVSAIASGTSFIITANGTLGNDKRAIETVIAPVPSVPLPTINSEASVGVFGDPTKMKLSLPGHRQSGESEDWDKMVKLSGFDTSANHQNVLGLGIQGADAYKSVMDKIAKKIADGKIPADIFEGDPIVDYIIGDKKKKETVISTSIGMVPTPSLDAAYWQDKAELIAEAIANLTPDRIISENDRVITTTQTWGTPLSPEITVVDAQRLTIQSGATVQGAGVLVVNGDISIKQLSGLKWEGTVIVTGGTGAKANDAFIRNERGSLEVTGTTVILGTGASKAKIQINDPTNNEDASTKFDGAVLVYAGKEDDKADKAEFKINHGGVEMDGLLALIGDKVKLEIHKGRSDKQFVMDGAVILAVPDDEKKTQANLKLSGYTSITYNSQKVKDAIAGLMNFLITYGAIDVRYSITSWREVTPQ
jgi:hypothetical protein